MKSIAQGERKREQEGEKDMQKTLEELIREGEKFMEEFEKLDEYGKIGVISYMRGYRDHECQQNKEKTA